MREMVGMIKVNTIKGYEEFSDIYWVGRDGEVYSEYKDMKPLKQRVTRPTNKSKNEYLEVCLMCEGKKRYIKTHRLVAKAFIPNPNNKPQVNHIDEDGLNNNVDNLEWMTAQENSRFSNAKKVYCYNIDGLVKIYDCLADVTKDGFNQGHVASCCRGDIPKGRKYPPLRHKKHAFSYQELTSSEVVQRLSKPQFFNPKGWRE